MPPTPGRASVGPQGPHALPGPSTKPTSGALPKPTSAAVPAPAQVVDPFAALFPITGVEVMPMGGAGDDLDFDDFLGASPQAPAGPSGAQEVAVGDGSVTVTEGAGAVELSVPDLSWILSSTVQGPTHTPTAVAGQEQQAPN
eukprot:jgi/Botrbrau1/18784/Bobra.0386s0100.1